MLTAVLNAGVTWVGATPPHTKQHNAPSTGTRRQSYHTKLDFPVNDNFRDTENVRMQ